MYIMKFETSKVIKNLTQTTLIVKDKNKKGVKSGNYPFNSNVYHKEKVCPLSM